MVLRNQCLRLAQQVMAFVTSMTEFQVPSPELHTGTHKHRHIHRHTHTRRDIDRALLDTHTHQNTESMFFKKKKKQKNLTVSETAQKAATSKRFLSVLLTNTFPVNEAPK